MTKAQGRTALGFGCSTHFTRHISTPVNTVAGSSWSAWAGASGGFQHVHFRLPGMAGTTAQLRFEYAQDLFGSCADVRPGHSCGVMIDNVHVSSVKSAAKQP